MAETINTIYKNSCNFFGRGATTGESPLQAPSKQPKSHSQATQKRPGCFQAKVGAIPPGSPIAKPKGGCPDREAEGWLPRSPELFLYNYSQNSLASMMNFDTIEDLAWAIAAGQGEFSLTFAHCNYVKWREELIKQLQLQLQLENQSEITRLQLEPGDLNIYEKIYQAIQQNAPSAMMVVGLETVENLTELLSITNNQRERFRADFKFPLILWVNDIVLGQFTELAMDFKTFGVTMYLPITLEMLQIDVNDNIQQFFNQILEIGGSQFISNAEILGQSYQQEIDAALA
jgi:hypothetical protein